MAARKKTSRVESTVRKAGATAAKAPAHLIENVQQIWLAGMGAFSKAQAEGGKVFETLVKEGMTIQRKTQAVAEERISEVTGKMTAMADDVTAKAGQKWDKLESIFEERVAKALGKLGVPSARDIEGLLERIDSLTSQVQSLGGQPAPVRKTAKRPVRAAAKTPVKTTSSAAPKAAPRKAPARKAAKPA